jgi:hypothetical protein
MKIGVDLKKLYGRDKLENEGLDGRIVLKSGLKLLTVFNWPRSGQCNCNESLGSIQGRDSFHDLCAVKELIG